MTGKGNSPAFDKAMQVPCPRCGEPIQMAATSCAGCRTQFTPDEVRQNIASKRTDPTGCIIVSVAVAIALVALVALLSTCSQGPTDPHDLSFEKQEPYWKEAAQEVVREKLRDPDSAIFTELEVHPGGEDSATIICGRVNSRNGFGGMTGPQRFIAGGTVMLEEDLTAAEMEIAWARFCP